MLKLLAVGRKVTGSPKNRRRIDSSRPPTLGSLFGCSTSHPAGVAEWKTQRTQNPPRFTPRGGSNPPSGTSKPFINNKLHSFPFSA